MLIESGQNVILMDPMLGEKGTSAPPFAWVRFSAHRNPLVDLPPDAFRLLDQTTHCLITHLHPDHLDRAGTDFLREKQIPVTCSVQIAPILAQKGLHVVQTLAYGARTSFLGGWITGIPAVHGYGWVAKLMGHVMGFVLELPDEPTLYGSSDTIYTPDVHRVLTEIKPDIAVVAAGSAQLDVLQPLLMRMDDVLRFIRHAPHQVMAHHLEALNHCPTTRIALQEAVQRLDLSGKVWIPADGEARMY